MPEAKAALGTERFAQAVQAVAARIETRLGWRHHEQGSVTPATPHRRAST
jgi:hypothetical protein